MLATEAAMPELIVEAICPGVTTVRINRPEKRNACNRAVWQGIADVLNELAQRDET